MTTPESVIEIGSTGIRLLIAEFSQDKKLNILDRSEMPIALGRDVFTNNEITQETQNQCIQILRRYVEQLAGWGIKPENTTIFATSAFRDAKNSDPVMDRILVQTGFRVKIIDGIEENRLMYLAINECFKDVNINYKNDSAILVVGGSTSEMMILAKGKMASVHSIKLGTVRIEEQIRSVINTYDDIHRFIQESVNTRKGSLESEFDLKKLKQFIAVGQPITLAAILIGQPISTFLWSIETEKFDKFVTEIQNYSIDECVARFKISYNDAENMQVSLLIYNMFIHLTNVKTILVPETNIRNGVILSKISTENEELQKEFNSQIVASARNLLRKYHGDEKHAECVKMISLKFYEVLKNELGLNDHARTLLETAAILHDIGVFINYENHNTHGYYIIRNSEIFGLSKIDRTIISTIAKYHRGKAMPQDEEGFLLLPRQDRMTIIKLTAILRIADALDRGHIQKFSDFSIKLQQNHLLIQTKNIKNTVLEKVALSEKAEMFEGVFGYKVLLD